MRIRSLLSEPVYRLYERRLERDVAVGRHPQHVGVILDGHRRYARHEGLAHFTESYEAGMAKFEELLEWSGALGIPEVTAWVLSTDNLARPFSELEPYFDVLTALCERIPDRARELGFSFRVIGSVDRLPSKLATAAKAAEEACPIGDWRVTMALGYGGRQEIVDACRAAVTELALEGVAATDLGERIDAASIQEHLYAGDSPDPDLIIRTSGEARLSGFLLWQSAYSEYIFVDAFWPAFRRIDLLRALREFSRRERRFGQ